MYGWVEEILIIDSYSTDKTIEIAKKYTNKIYQHPFKNQSKQFNWALDNLSLKGEWIMRLDADERITSELKEGQNCVVIIPDGVRNYMSKFMDSKWRSENL